MSNPTPDERWEQGIDHDPRSEKIFHGIAKIDWEKNNDLMCFKHGGDGDNGESLMFLLDCYFAEEDEAKETEVGEAYWKCNGDYWYKSGCGNRVETEGSYCAECQKVLKDNKGLWPGSSETR